MRCQALRWKGKRSSHHVEFSSSLRREGVGISAINIRGCRIGDKNRVYIVFSIVTSSNSHSFTFTQYGTSRLPFCYDLNRMCHATSGATKHAVILLFFESPESPGVVSADRFYPRRGTHNRIEWLRCYRVRLFCSWIGPASRSRYRFSRTVGDNFEVAEMNDCWATHGVMLNLTITASIPSPRIHPN